MEEYFAVAAPGLEEITRGELVRLGLLPELSTDQSASSILGSGGVAFSGSRKALYRANLCLATASRVLVRLGEFYAASFPELVKNARRLNWEAYILPGLPVAIHASCHKSKLYHSGAVAERVAMAISHRLGQPVVIAKPAGGDGARGASPEMGDEPAPPQLVIVRLVRDQVTISVDSSGALLHRRGYRLETAKAPLRETLAAAMLLASGWDGVSPLLDPFCGSGTIVIEAARTAMGIPPGSGREFACMRWPGFKPEDWEQAAAGCRPKVQPASPVFQGSDRDAGAVRIAQANAERAGVSGVVEFTCWAVSAIEPPPGPGWVVTNPPYGVRVSARQDLRNLYAQIGNVLRAKCPGWNAAILCSDPALLGHTRLGLETTFSMVNGGLKVFLGRGRIK